MPGNYFIRTTCAKARRERGFSTLELVLVVAIMLILSAIAVPQIMSTMRTYQLDSAAGQVADAVKFSRFEAIRSNVSRNCISVSPGGIWEIGTDDNPQNGALDNTERQYELTGTVTLLTAANVPTAGALPGALNVGAVQTTRSKTITFDPRGAVNFATSTGGATTVYVFFVGPTVLPAREYRAVVILPSGITQVWAGSPAGPWHQMS